MRVVGTEVLHDPAYRVPEVGPAADGVAWLRAHVVRFSEGSDRVRRRQLVERLIEQMDRPVPRQRPSHALLLALGLPADLDGDVATVAAAYQPSPALSPALSPVVDAAADRLVAACGGRTEESAARVCVLVQAHAATLALLDHARRGDPGPPVPTTRRIAPDGQEVLVDLSSAPFGAGRHRCPGEALARQLVDGAALVADGQ